MVKRRKSQPPRRKNNDGVNPLLVALGAGAGAAAGRAAATPLSRRSVARDAREYYKADRSLGRGYSNTEEESTNRAARSVADSEYSRMPRVEKSKLANYRGLLENRTAADRSEPGSYDRAAKLSGMSNRDRDKYINKGTAKSEIESAKAMGKGGSARLLSEAGYLRAKRTKTRSSVKGGAAGGALAVLAQLVAAEMSKKKKK